MTRVTTKLERLQPSVEDTPELFDEWFDPIESGLRERVRELIEEMIRSELDAVLSRPRYGRRGKPADGGEVAAGVAGHRHGSRVQRWRRKARPCSCAPPSAATISEPSPPPCCGCWSVTAPPSLTPPFARGSRAAWLIPMRCGSHSI